MTKYEFVHTFCINCHMGCKGPDAPEASGCPVRDQLTKDKK